MWIVGIETSGREGSVALILGDETVAVRSLSMDGRRHARTLVAELQLMLKDASVNPEDIDAIAVSRGPGSFTGLRIGVMCAKTWAFVTERPVVGVDTLLAVAERAPKEVDALEVIADAQRGDLYLGRYRRSSNGEWLPLRDIAIISGELWRDSLSGDSVVTGPATEVWKDRLPERTSVLPREFWFPHAVEIARIGRRRVRAGEVDDALSLEPLYLRRSAAEEKRDPLPQAR